MCLKILDKNIFDEKMILLLYITLSSNQDQQYIFSFENIWLKEFFGVNHSQNMNVPELKTETIEASLLFIESSWKGSFS